MRKNSFKAKVDLRAQIKGKSIERTMNVARTKIHYTVLKDSEPLKRNRKIHLISTKSHFSVKDKNH